MKYFHRVYDDNVKNDLLNYHGTILLGKLIVKTDAPAAIYKVPGTENIAIQIMPLSKEPSQLVELRKNLYKDDVYTALDRDQFAFMINDLAYYSKNASEKIEHWQNLLDRRLIVFKTFVEADGEKISLKTQIQSLETADERELDKTYFEIPHLQESVEMAEFKFYNEKPITFTQYSQQEGPKYVLIDDYLYYHFPKWHQHESDFKTWFIPDTSILTDANSQTGSNIKIDTGIYRAKLTEFSQQLDSGGVETNEDLTFLSTEVEQELILKLVEFGELVPLRKTLPTINMNPKTSLAPQPYAPIDPRAVKAEYTFLDELRGLTLSENLLYDQKDLTNFHISLKTNPLTVVAGMSGTGKTRLAKAYAKILGLAEEQGDLLFLPISPSYLEPSDVLGYLNPTSGYFIPSEAGLVDILVRAQNNPHAMHMVIFDEMNLSQVEHWFAPFLSILEKPEHDRLLHLYSENATCHNADIYPPSVNIGGNILFVGTINLDETTKELSDRLLDRVNLVTLKKSGFMHFSTLDLEKATYHGITFTYNDILSWKNHELPTKAFKPQELQFFDELHKLISKYDAQKGVSFRFLNRLGRYIQNIPLDEKGEPLIYPSKAMDISIKQGLLTKIKGSKQQIGRLIGEITDPESEVIGSELLDFINENRAIKANKFNRTKAEIKRKALELGLYGYTN